MRLGRARRHANSRCRKATPTGRSYPFVPLSLSPSSLCPFIPPSSLSPSLGATAGSLTANLRNEQGEGARAAEEIVVAVDAGDHCVFEGAKGGDGLGHAAGLIEVDRLGAALGHGAEAAAAGAEVAQHHEGRGFVVPALADVQGSGPVADGVEVQASGRVA